MATRLEVVVQVFPLEDPVPQQAPPTRMAEDGHHLEPIHGHSMHLEYLVGGHEHVLR